MFRRHHFHFGISNNVTIMESAIISTIMVKAAAVFAILTSFLLHKGLCYPSGAPVGKCGDMTPGHSVAAQTGASPYEIKVAKPYYMPSQNVTVSIESSTDNIKGFLIQARQVGANSATGMFRTLPAFVKYLACGNNKGAATHETRLVTRTLNFEWEPPAGLTGNISFLATVVKDKTTFWVKLQSPELYKKEMPSQSSQPAPTATKQAMPSSQPMPNSQSMHSQSETSKTMKPMTGSVSIAKSTPTGINPTSKATQLPNTVASLVFFMGLLMAVWH